MTADGVLAALELPPAARVERRVPKGLLMEHGAPTAADKRRIQEELEQIQWVATLKPTTVGVAVHRAEDREYLEIAVLRVTLRGASKPARLLQLLHRAVPYPVFAVTEVQGCVHLSLAHKRWSQGQAGKTVLDGELVAVDFDPNGEPHVPPFLEALALGRQPQASLLAVYQGWMDALFALEAARRTGRFEIPESAERRTARREALGECSRLEAELARIRTAAAREKQMSRQVELNLEHKRTEAARAAALLQL